VETGCWIRWFIV